LKFREDENEEEREVCKAFNAVGQVAPEEMGVPLHQRLRSNVEGRDPIIALGFTLYRHQVLSKSTHWA